MNSDEMAAIVNLISLAEAVNRIPETEPDRFLAELVPYLESFDYWIAARGEDSPPDSTLKPKVEQLNALHQRIVQRAEAHREQLSQQLAEIHRRAQGLRAYVDRYPSRITVAGKREG